MPPLVADSSFKNLIQDKKEKEAIRMREMDIMIELRLVYKQAFKIYFNINQRITSIEYEKN